MEAQVAAEEEEDRRVDIHQAAAQVEVKINRNLRSEQGGKEDRKSIIKEKKRKKEHIRKETKIAYNTKKGK